MKRIPMWAMIQLRSPLKQKRRMFFEDGTVIVIQEIALDRLIPHDINMLMHTTSHVLHDIKWELVYSRWN